MRVAASNYRAVSGMTRVKFESGHLSGVVSYMASVGDLDVRSSPGWMIGGEAPQPIACHRELSKSVLDQTKQSNIINGYNRSKLCYARLDVQNTQ